MICLSLEQKTNTQFDTRTEIQYQYLHWQHDMKQFQSLLFARTKLLILFSTSSESTKNLDLESNSRLKAEAWIRH